MSIGTCRMCLLDKELVRSHLIPAALYDYCREGDVSPVKVGGGIVMQTDRQTWTYLLCLKCEGILNAGGETWTNPKLATAKHTFPLYDLLMNSYVAYQEGQNGIYFSAGNPDFSFQSLAHFAMGIFWKASVHSWKGGERAHMIELGPYSDQIRTWLRGETAFPKHVVITVTFSHPAKALVTLNEPVQTNFRPWRTFFLHVPGVLFMLNTGKTIDAEMRETCFYKNHTHPVFVAEDITEKWSRDIAEHYRGCRKTRGYLETLEKLRLNKVK